MRSRRSQGRPVATAAVGQTGPTARPEFSSTSSRTNQARLFRLVNRQHPRALARIRPTQLALWSFAIATAHGAGLMLLPIYLGLCSSEELDAAHQASSILMAQNSATAVLVSLVHTISMVTAGGVIALLVFDWLGLKFLSKELVQSRLRVGSAPSGS